MPVSKRLRHEVMRRDNYTCRYCGGEPPDVKLVVDHVTPEALGGASVPENLVTACQDCNAGKAAVAPDSPIVANVADDALRWAKAMEQAAAAQRQAQDDLDEFCAGFYEGWGSYYALPSDWRASVEKWRELGADERLLFDCIDIAFAAKGVSGRWRYFCGVVWRKLNERQEMARDLITDEENSGTP